jgi:ABC-type antimicrobial peptide transport system permease subunit
MALGAQRRQVVGLVLNAGLKLVALGLILGLAAAAITARLIQSLLFSVEPFDPVIYAGVAIMFVVIAALACILPSVRASRVDPLIALRTE